MPNADSVAVGFLNSGGLHIDRSRIEFQPPFVVLLAALAPVWGASAPFSFSLALRGTWIEDDDQFSQKAQRRARDHGFGPHHDSEAEAMRADVAAIASESVYGRLLESGEGERVLEMQHGRGHESDSLSATEKTSPAKRTCGVPAAASTPTPTRSARKSAGWQ
ncbi:hypothetical protein ACQY0O_001101 [Thecaphora frezii]